MPLTTRKRPRIGDVIEIPTAQGFAYAHYTHKHVAPPHWGAVLHVLPGIFTERPQDFAALVQQPAQFITFFPLGASCHRGIVSVVAAESVPAHARDFPIFWSGYRDPSGHLCSPWFLWDGEREWRVDSLTPEQIRAYPRRSIINPAMLVHWIIRGRPREHDE